MKLTYLLLFSIFSTLSLAEDKVDQKSDTSNAIDKTHQSISHAVLFLSNRIDSFFGNKKGDDYESGTKIRLFWTGEKKEYQNYTSEFNAKIRLVFPELQKKLKVSFKNKDKKPKNQSTNGQAVSEQKSNQIVTKSQRWNYHFDLGVKVDFPPDLYSRLRIDKSYIIGKWNLKPNQEFFWLLKNGFGETTSLNLDRDINDSILFRLQNEVSWHDDTDKFSSTHGPSLYYSYSPKTAISLNLKALGTNKPVIHINEYYASIHFRQLIYKNWFFYELSPIVSFPKTNEFKKILGFSIKFEAVFGSI